MQLNRIDAFAKAALGNAACDQPGQNFDHALVALGHVRDLAQVLGAVNVFVHHQADQLGMLRVIAHIMLDQPAQRLGRGAAFQIDRRLAFADAVVGAFEHGAVEIVLALEIVVDLALGRAARDLVDARTGKAFLHEFLRGDIDDLADRLLAGLCMRSARWLGGLGQRGISGRVHGHGSAGGQGKTGAHRKPGVAAAIHACPCR